MKKLVILILASLFLVSCAQNQEGTPEETTSEIPVLETTEVFDENANEVEVVVEDEMDVEVEEVTVLKSAMIEEGQHDATANVIFRSDNTFSLENFSYDGQAPDTYISVGNFDDNGNFVFGANITPVFDRAYDDETLIFELNSEIVLDDYSAVSIWCHRFSEDFASAKLE